MDRTVMMITKNPLILVGGGGHCKSVINVAEKCDFKVLGIIDRPDEVGKKVLDYEVIGCDDDIVKYIDTAIFHITVGFIKNPTLRIRLFEHIRTNGGKLATIVSPTACVSKYSKIGIGTAVMNFANINADTSIGDNVIINTFANIEHDTTVGNHTHISTGVMINGGCKIGERCFIGSQSVIANGISICDDVIVGAGSVVIKDISTKGVYAGNPARQIK